MTVGTRTLLVGVHQPIIHALFVARAWWRLFGFPWDPRLWIAFLVHDLGYWGRPSLEDEDGERHVEFGAWIMGFFGWADFARHHSRFYARRDGVRPSLLCYADKLAIILTPTWLYLLQGKLSGEIIEYRSAKKYGRLRNRSETDRQWLERTKREVAAWLTEEGLTW